MENDQLTQEQLDFIAELRRWRDVRGLSQKALAKRVDYDPSYVSKIETGTMVSSREFAEKADRVLEAGRELVRHWIAMSEVVSKPETVGHHAPAMTADLDFEPTATLIVEHEIAHLVYASNVFTTTVRRQIYNRGAEPVTRYLIRIAVDKYPGDPERSNRLYREDPLTWEEIQLTASCEGEQMRWTTQHDRDAFKEVWLLFENEDGRFALYPGQRTWIEYTYNVRDHKWGPWWQRAIRLPTRRLQMTLDLPSEVQPKVWGTETSMSAGASTFRNQIQESRVGDRQIFTWSTTSPPLHGRYRMEWRFRAQTPESPMPTMTPSQLMAQAGIIQEGDPVLREVTRPMSLPADSEDVHRIVIELASALARITQVHSFSKGVGIAAPQIGIRRSIALVETPEGERITLINPRVIDRSFETDEQYEGCLSFFDVRGLVPRPLMIEVEHQDVHGTLRITQFHRGDARLVLHEIDHLNGILYRDLMRSGVVPVPVEQYHGTGQSWKYPS